MFFLHPNKKAFPRIKLNVPVDWCAKYPEEVWVYKQGPRDAEGIRQLVGSLISMQNDLTKHTNNTAAVCAFSYYPKDTLVKNAIKVSLG